MSTFIIGIDLGTTGLKVALIDVNGQVMGQSYSEIKITSPKPGVLEQDADDYLMGAVKGIKNVLEIAKINPSDVVAIGFDGQMGGLVGIARDYMPVTHYDSVLDTRSQPFSARIKEKYEPVIFQSASGVWNHASKLLWWKNERPSVYKQVYKFVTLTPYVAGRMAGLKGNDAYIDYTSLLCSGIHEVKTHTWSHDLCHLLHIDMDKLPVIVDPWKIIGKLTVQTAHLCGLKEGIPLVAGAGDQPAGFLGAGIVESGYAIDVAGSTSVFSVCTGEFIPDMKYKRIVYMNSVFPDLYYALTYVSGGGIAVRWFKDQFAVSEKQESEQSGVNVFSILDKKICTLEPGSGDLLFMPHLGGRACPNEPEIRGAWIGLNWGHSHLHMYRAILESIAYDQVVTLEAFEELFPDIHIDTVRVIGGGSKSRIWNQIKSDVLNLPYARLDRQELAVLGSSMIAGYATGVYADLKKTAQMQALETGRIRPRAGNHKKYRKYIRAYRKIFDCLQPVWGCLTGESIYS